MSFPFKLSGSNLHRFTLPALGVWRIPKGNWSVHTTLSIPPFSCRAFAHLLLYPPDPCSRDCCCQFLQWLAVCHRPRWQEVRTDETLSFHPSSHSHLSCLPWPVEAFSPFTHTPTPPQPSHNTSESSDSLGTSHRVVFYSFLVIRSSNTSFPPASIVSLGLIFGKQPVASVVCHFDRMREWFLEWTGVP